MKIKWGKPKRVKSASKNLKFYTAEITITDLPKIVNIHIKWSHPDAYDKTGIAPAFGWVDDLREIYYDDYLFYRALMLEAGFVPIYFWKQEIPHPLTYMKPPKINIPKNWKPMYK